MRVGDRIRLLVDLGFEHSLQGDHGTIVWVNPSDENQFRYEVKVDSDPGGHVPWPVKEHEVEPLADEPLPEEVVTGV